MKIVVKIIGVLAVLAAFFLCSLGSSRNFSDAEEIGEFQKKLDKFTANFKADFEKTGDKKSAEIFEKALADAKKQNGIKDIPSKSTFENSAMLIALLLVLSIVSAVFLFLPRVTVSMVILGITVLACLGLIMIAPDMGEKSRATNVQVAWLSIIPAFLAALCAFANAKLASPKKAL